MAKVPKRMQWLFWELDATKLDTERAATNIIPRVLEFGGLDEVRWLLSTYSKKRIHTFLRDVGHPELSAKTLSFWRAVFHAEAEPWQDRRASRGPSAGPWID